MNRAIVLVAKTEVQSRTLREGVINRLKHLQNRLRIGWGTLRVAAGMALGQQVYDMLFSLTK